MKRILTLILLAGTLALGTDAAAQKKKAPAAPQGPKYDVAAYLYPAYAYNDPRLRPFWTSGMGEWETVLTMQKRNPGHYWKRMPLWGPVNEADPAVMEMEVEQATRHGVNVFIFDWYWYDGRPFMETTLTDGFLKASNRDKMKFYLMWANHDVENYWDTRISQLGEKNVIWTGRIDRDEFEKICLRNIELFFKQPNYYKIDGKPVFMIYDVKNFIDGLGGVDAAADAVKWFRKEVKKAGFPDPMPERRTSRRKRSCARSDSPAPRTTSSATSSMSTTTTRRSWTRPMSSGRSWTRNSPSRITRTSASAGTTAPGPARAR